MLEVIFADKKIFLKKHTQSISSPSYTLYILTYFNVGNRNLRSKPSLFPPSPRGKKKRKEGGEKITEKVSETSNSDSGLKEAVGEGGRTAEK